MSIEDLNLLSEVDAASEFLRCCGCSRWASTMAARRPFRGLQELVDASESLWENLSPSDWKEAFAHHPKIGDMSALREKYRPTAAWAAKEQSGIQSASENILGRLAEGNRNYEEKFGYIFIVCATGKSAKEMLDLLHARLHNDPQKEILIAAEEQRKITAIRLQELLSS